VAVQLGGPAAVVAAYVLAAAAQSIAQGVVAWRLAIRHWMKAEKPADSHWLRPLAVFGVHTSVTTSLLATDKSLIPIILGAVAGPATAGVFNIALLPITIAGLATAPIRMLLFPEQSRLAAAGDVGALRRSVRGYTGIGLAVGVPAAIAGFFLLPWLIPALFSDQFSDAVEPARIMLLSGVISLAIFGWAKTLPAAIGKPQLRTLISVLYLVLSVGLTAALAPAHGATGAAIANAVASTVTAAAWLLIAKRSLRQLAGAQPVSPVAS
jgi:O-antigen/teichoic acid export membrane protein